MSSGQMHAEGDRASDAKTVGDYPRMIAAVNHIEPVPRRVRAFLGDAIGCCGHSEEVLAVRRKLWSRD